jgi:hypothetical protein
VALGQDLAAVHTPNSTEVAFLELGFELMESQFMAGDIAEHSTPSGGRRLQ